MSAVNLIDVHFSLVRPTSTYPRLSNRHAIPGVGARNAKLALYLPYSQRPVASVARGRLVSLTEEEPFSLTEENLFQH